MADETNLPGDGIPEDDDTNRAPRLTGTSGAVEDETIDVLPEDLDLTAPATGGSRSRESSVGSASSVEAERDQYRELAQRLQADFENYKKRVAKQDVERIARAEENLVVKLLPVLDTIDLALTHDPNGSLEQVRSALLEVLQKAGLERVAEIEAAFDPTHHEAVMHEPGEGEQRVTEIMRAGYRWNGRVVRPAMVKVTGS